MTHISSFRSRFTPHTRRLTEPGCPMCSRAHEHLGMHPPAATPASLFQPLQKNQAVIVGFKHHLPAIATGHDMIHRSRILEPQRSRHASFSSMAAPASILIWRNARTGSQTFIGGAILGNRSRTPVLYIANSWGGLDKHKPLMDNVLSWPRATSPKLPPADPEPDASEHFQSAICPAA